MAKYGIAEIILECLIVFLAEVEKVSVILSDYLQDSIMIMLHDIRLPFTSVSVAVSQATILAFAATTFSCIGFVVDTPVVVSMTSPKKIVRTLTHVSFRRSNTYVTPAKKLVFTITRCFWEVGRRCKSDLQKIQISL